MNEYHKLAQQALALAKKAHEKADELYLKHKEASQRGDKKAA